MALFDSIISGVAEKFGLGDKAGTLLSALLALMTNSETGGLSGFLGKFADAGLGNLTSSWISGGDNIDVSGEQLESVLGADTIGGIADQVGIPSDKASSAIGYMLPQVVDKLTPDGEVPDNESVLSKVGDLLSGWGGTAAGVVAGAAGAAGAVASGAVDKVGDAAEAVGDTASAAVDKGKEVVGDAADAVSDVAGKATETVGSAFNTVGDTVGGGDGGSILKWLLPLLLLGLLLLIGFMYCGGNGTTTTDGNVNANANSNTNADSTDDAVESSVKLEAKDGKYTITGVVKDEETKNNILKEAEATWGEGNVDVSGLKVDANAKPFTEGWFDNFKKALALPSMKEWKDGAISWTGNAIETVGEIPGAITDGLKSLFSGWTLGGLADAAKDTADSVADKVRELADVALPDGTKLQAYPGGIEDQLIKYIESDEYKNATEEDLKNKWFDFDDLTFKFNSVELEPSSQRQLDNIVAILKAHPDVKIKIGGYTDKKGDDAANKKLSQNRANAVKAALEKAGVGAQVPEAEGYGEEFAKVDEAASDEERAADRKTAIRLIK